MSRRSNCASAEKTWKMSSPDGVVVSIAPSHTERKPTPVLQTGRVGQRFGNPLRYATSTSRVRQDVRECDPPGSSRPVSPSRNLFLGGETSMFTRRSFLAAATSTCAARVLCGAPESRKKIAFLATVVHLHSHAQHFL